MIDLTQKARAGRTRAIALLNHAGDNVFFDAPTNLPENRKIVREKADRIFAALQASDMHLAV